MQVELKAAFTGLTWLPSWIALSSSSLSPHLILGEIEIDYKVIRTGRCRYDDIASVDFRKAWETRNVILRFKDRSTTFTGNVVSDEAASEALRCFRSRGCLLTDRAADFIGREDSN